MTNEQLLNSYLLNIIKFSVDIMQNIDCFDLNEKNVAEIGEIVTKLKNFKNNYIELPF